MRFALAFLITASAVCAQKQTNDWLIVPGVRVGPITASTAPDDLVRIFGARNITEDSIFFGDIEFPGLTIKEGRPEDSLAIAWPQEGEKKISFISPCYYAKQSCRWHTADGISYGTTVKALERLNGRPFEFAGFDWDYGGVIRSWKGGKLESLEKTSCLTVGFGFDISPDGGEKIAGAGDLVGDRTFSSSLPAMQAWNPKITRIWVNFQGCHARGKK